jgi:hypothetical protein
MMWLINKSITEIHVTVPVGIGHTTCRASSYPDLKEKFIVGEK